MSPNSVKCHEDIPIGKEKNNYKNWDSIIKYFPMNN